MLTIYLLTTCQGATRGSLETYPNLRPVCAASQMILRPQLHRPGSRGWGRRTICPKLHAKLWPAKFLPFKALYERYALKDFIFGRQILSAGAMARRECRKVSVSPL